MVLKVFLKDKNTRPGKMPGLDAFYIHPAFFASNVSSSLN